MDKILVSNTGGILSSNLIDMLLKNDENIIYAPNINKGDKFANLCSLLKNERFNLVDENISSINLPFVDYIYFLDCCDNEFYFEDKYRYNLELIQKIKNILEFTTKTGSKLLIALPFCDYQNTNKELFEYYDLIKFLTGLVLYYANKYKTNIQIVRLCNYYGFYTSKNSPNFIIRMIFSALNNEDITIENKKMHLCYSKDIAIALVKIMHNITDDIIDISSANFFYDKEIADFIINYTKSKSKIIYKNNILSIPNYETELSYIKNHDINLTTPINEGLSKTIDFIKLVYFT